MTDNTSQIPQWAKVQACELANATETPFGNTDWTADDVEKFDSMAAFARYIVAHEEAPVDPLLKPVADALCSSGIFRDDDWTEAAETFLAEIRERGLDVVQVAA